MFCLKCGQGLPEEAQFCLQCGHQISMPNSETKPNETWYTIRTIIITLLVGLGLWVVVLFGAEQYQASRSSRYSARTSFASATTPAPRWEQSRLAFQKESIALNAGGWWWQSFDVDSNWRNVRLVGRFTAQGGSGNDVVVVVTDEVGKVNFENNHGYRTWYNPGKITADKVNVALPPGKYYLIFSNRFSIFAHKSVEMKFQVEYERLVTP